MVRARNTEIRGSQRRQDGRGQHARSEARVEGIAVQSSTSIFTATGILLAVELYILNATL